MSYAIKPLDVSTWEAFAALVEANNGVFGGCWCPGFTRGFRATGVSEPASEGSSVSGVVRAHAALVFDGDDCLGWCQFGISGRAAASQEPERSTRRGSTHMAP